MVYSQEENATDVCLFYLSQESQPSDRDYGRSSRFNVLPYRTNKNGRDVHHLVYCNPNKQQIVNYSTHGAEI